MNCSALPIVCAQCATSVNTFMTDAFISCGLFIRVCLRVFTWI